jgi:hypothetical protein
LVERNLAKVKVAGSSLVSRSKKIVAQATIFFPAWVVELVDTQDLKSCDCKVVRVQVPSRAQVSEVLPLKLFFWSNICQTFLPIIGTLEFIKYLKRKKKKEENQQNDGALERKPCRENYFCDLKKIY